MKKFIIISFFIFLSCEKSKVFSLKKLEKIHVFEKSCLELQLIKSYPNTDFCNDDTVNVNMFFCHVFNSKDTVLIFEPCQDKPFEFSNVSPNIICQQDVIESKSGYVRIKFSDKNIRLQNKKYLIGTLDYLRE